MQDTPGSLIGHAAVAACLMLGLCGSARAQSPAPAPSGPEFLARSEFHLGANSLALQTDDERFSWDAYFGGTVDVFDYVKGRASMVADYHPVLGSEFRPFDPNQAYYILEVSSSYRAGETEIAGVFHHVSRHLSDRPKQFAIAWNVLGARVMRRVEMGGVTVDARVDGGAIVQHSYVDYQWTADADVTIRREITPRFGAFAHGSVEVFAVDGSEPARGTQRGGRVEAGVRINGRGGAIELFAGVERRLDADPIDRLPMQWAVAGFRLFSR
jgi:hypothetical protein